MTPTQIQFAALKELGAVDLYATAPEAELGQAVQEKYNSLHAQLLEAGLANWALTENVPTKAEQPVIWMLAFLCANSEKFGALAEKKQELAPLGSLLAERPSLGEKQLRAMFARRYVPQAAQSEYF